MASSPPHNLIKAHPYLPPTYPLHSIAFPTRPLCFASQTETWGTRKRFVMAEEHSGKRSSNSTLLEELEALSQSLNQPHNPRTRRTASLALPRGASPPIPTEDEDRASTKPRSRRMSLSPWHSRPKPEDANEEKERTRNTARRFDDKMGSEEKKGIWKWKPMRALSHIGRQKLSCLFSVEVVAAQNLPASMNGLRLSVCVRKKETKDGAVHTMPSRVQQGAAEFEETLFIKCHVYCAPSNGKFEPRPFWVYLFAVDAQKLDFGRNSLDLSQMIQESLERSSEGDRIRQWEVSFDLFGKAKGGELVLKLGFQVMEKDGGIGLYNQANQGLKSSKSRNFSASFARKQSKTSFSVPSPRITSTSQTWNLEPSVKAGIQGIDHLNLDEPAVKADIQGIDHLNLDEPAETKTTEEAEERMEDEMPDFEVVDKGVEFQDKDDTGDGESDGTVGAKSASSEVVKEMVHDPAHQMRLSELCLLAQQIKALESMMRVDQGAKDDEETSSQRLDDEEETVTREFLQMLEYEETGKSKYDYSEVSSLHLDGADDVPSESESKTYISDLGKGIGCVVQTRDGGYLVAMNPFDTVVSRKETPKLVMQMSKPLVLQSNEATSGFELFQRMAGYDLEEISSKIASSMPMDELMGKTGEQVAFEGIASAIIQGRNKERASSSAARTIAAVKSMVNAMSMGRKERISTGIWNVDEHPLTAEEILAVSLQKIEALAMESLKVQADMSQDEAPFDVAPPFPAFRGENPLNQSITLEDWIKNHSLMNSSDKEQETSLLTIAVLVLLRDPIRRYEGVGGPVLALVHAERSDSKQPDDEKRFKISSLTVGGLRVFEKRNSWWDAERQRLTAAQWLVAYGLGKKGKSVPPKKQNVLWSISSRVMADMWLRSIRNPDIRLS